MMTHMITTVVVGAPLQDLPVLTCFVCFVLPTCIIVTINVSALIEQECNVCEPDAQYIIFKNLVY